jgi:hypothetical protein
MSPTDPVLPLREMAVQMHELFTEYVHAGFNRKEALYLIGQQIHAASTVQSQGGAETP